VADEGRLIDNRLDLVSAWRDVGGAGYWFQNDEQFVETHRSFSGCHAKQIDPST
jgi:hypothetical protein